MHKSGNAAVQQSNHSQLESNSMRFSYNT